MNRLTLRNFITGALFIVTGLFFMFYPSDNHGLFLYFLLVFGVWEIGEGLSNVLDGSWKWETEEEKTVEQLKYEFRSEIIHVTIPILLSIVVEMFLASVELQVYTVIAYLLVWAVYVVNIIIYYYYEPFNNRRKERQMQRLSRTYQREEDSEAEDEEE